jgi:hypothetical protein
LGQLAWGETDPPPDWVIDQSGDDDHEGHCSFTSLDAVQPSSTKLCQAYFQLSFLGI